MKTCKRCELVLPVESFGQQKDTRDGLRTECKPCRIEYTRQWRAKNAEHHTAYMAHRYQKRKGEQREYQDRYYYGLEPGQYDALLAAQGGGCAGCYRPPLGRRLAVDHDHTCCPGPRSCGKCVRGLLCDPCNRAIGLLLDDPARMRRLAQYVEEPGTP